MLPEKFACLWHVQFSCGNLNPSTTDGREEKNINLFVLFEEQTLLLVSQNYIFLFKLD